MFIHFLVAERLCQANSADKLQRTTHPAEAPSEQQIKCLPGSLCGAWTCTLTSLFRMGENRFLIPSMNETGFVDARGVTAVQMTHMTWPQRRKGCDAYMGQGQNQFSSGSSGGHCCLWSRWAFRVMSGQFLPVAQIQISSDLRLTFVNPAATVFFGVQSEPGTQAVHFSPTADQPPLYQALQQLLTPHAQRETRSGRGERERVGLCG